MDYFMFLFFIYNTQVLLAAVFNIFNGTREPYTLRELFLFTCLPYVLIYRKDIR